MLLGKMYKKELTTPVLFLIFNRPDTTEKVFKQIKIAKPKKLYVVADGPRKNNAEDEKNCILTRKLINNIDWDCDLKKLYRDENLGCKNSVSSAITWFFENEEMGIILEDDCYPDESFFEFCQILLKRYESENQVMMIAGTNYLDKDILNFILKR